MCKRALLVFVLLAVSPLLTASTEADKLNQLIAGGWQWQLRDDPENATYLGERGHDDRLNYDLFLLQTKMAVEGDRFPAELVPLQQMHLRRPPPG